MHKFRSPAKLDLIIKVVGKHPDGSFQWETVSHPLDCCDQVSVCKSDQLQFIGEVITAQPTVRSSLQQACRLLFKEISADLNAVVNIEKCIPEDLGLSFLPGYVATTLWAFNQVFGLELPDEVLAAIANKVHPEAAVYFQTILPFSQTDKVTLIRPTEHLPESALFQRLNVEELHSPSVEVALKKVQDGNRVFFNDFEEHAFALSPKLALLKAQLMAAGFDFVGTTGTCSSLYCLGEARTPWSQSLTRHETTFLQREAGSWY